MKFPVTPVGYAKMRTELLSLKSQRPALSRAIEVARAHGDISENADYDAAKDKSGMVEAKIRDLESKLALAEVIDPRERSAILTKVVFGVSVVIEDIDSGEQKNLTIVGTDESDTEKGYISFEAPLGKSLIGKEVNDIVKVATPSGAKEFEILEISFVDWTTLLQEFQASVQF
jgi:transcription elongation factor GreA